MIQDIEKLRKNEDKNKLIDKFVENSWKWLETPYLHSFFKGFHADMATLSQKEYLMLINLTNKPIFQKH